MKRLKLALIALIALVMLILPASAALNQIAQGGDVFIGEENLDVTAAVGAFTQIAWFAAGTVPATDTPNFIIVVGSPASFYVSPADFVGRTGNWYRWNGGVTRNQIAFNVIDPIIDIKVWNQNSNRDVTGKQVIAGTFLNFRIETNSYSVISRPGYAVGQGFINIKVKTASGSTYTALWQTNLDTVPAISHPLNNNAVTSSLWYWVPVGVATQGWNTFATDSGNRLYRAGTYTVRAELDLNKIKDNYKAPDGSYYTGKTESALKTISITDPLEYTITTTVSEGGTINPVLVQVPTGSSQVFTITPSPGYQIASVLVDGVNQGSVNSYTFYNVQSPHTIAVIFTIINNQPNAVNLSLKPGWNFVSTPKTLADGMNTAGVVFAGVDTAARSIYLYNARDLTWEAMTASSIVRPLDGIWIYSTKTMEIPLTFRSGGAAVPPTKQVYLGWNAIGFSDVVAKSVHSSLISIDDPPRKRWATVLPWDPVSQTYESSITYYDSGNLQPTKGYWLFMNGDSANYPWVLASLSS